MASNPARRILKFDCLSGISGDMCVSAFHDLLENAGLDADALISVIQAIKDTVTTVSGIEVNFEHVMKNGFAATRMELDIQEVREHVDIDAIESNLVSCMDAAAIGNPGARAFAENALDIIVDAETKVHGMQGDHDDHDHGSVESHVHLHELASADTIVDILCVTRALELLGYFDEHMIVKVHAGPVSTGRGSIKTAHGTVPVPAPGTLEILQSHGIPFIDGPVDGAELATPTGCALLAAMNPDFSGMQVPAMAVAIGLGAGKKTFESVPNILRLQLLEPGVQQGTNEKIMASYVESSPFQASVDEVTQVTIVLDDATPEDVGYLLDKSYKAGAREAYSRPVHMKKSRLGVEVVILCAAATVQDILGLWMEESTTLGCRVERISRVVLDRVARTYQIDLESGEKTFSGDVGVKFIMIKPDRESSVVTSRPLFKIEHDDLKNIAETLGISIHAARTLVEAKLREFEEFAGN